MNKYLSFIFASVLTLTGVQLSKASNPSDSLAIVSANGREHLHCKASS